MQKILCKKVTTSSKDEGITYNSMAILIFHFKSLELEEELVSDMHLPTGLGRREKEEGLIGQPCWMNKHT